MVCCLTAIVLLTSCEKNTSVQHVELLDAVNARLDSAVAQVRELSRTTVYNAKAVPAFEELSFDIDGYIYGIYANPGEEVEEGEVLATLVSKDYEEMQSLRNEIKNLTSSDNERFKMREADIELAKAAGEDVAEQELLLKHEKEQSQLKIDIRKERLKILEESDIGYRYIMAPRDCLAVAAFSARRGAYVKAGTAIVALETEGDPYLTCDYMNENKYRKLHDCYAIIDGERYEIEYIPYSRSELKNISASSNVTLKSKFKVVGNPDLVAGESATIITVSDYRENVLAIPSNAIYSDSSGEFVYVVNDDVRTRRDITTGITDGTYTEIVEGLEEGTFVYVKD